MDNEVVITVPRKRYPRLRRRQGFRFDMYCWTLYWKDNEIINGNQQERDDNLFVRNVMYFAAYSYDKEHRVRKRKYDKHTVQYWIDNTYQPELLKVLEALKSSEVGGKTLKTYIEEEQEKKK